MSTQYTPNYDFWMKLNNLDTQAKIDDELKLVFDLSKANYHGMDTRTTWMISLLLAKRQLLDSKVETGE